jgi:transposase
VVHHREHVAADAVSIAVGPLGGVNNKIKTLSRQAYDFRDQDDFRLKLYPLHKTKRAIVG